jgi:hypothetical protein
MDFLDARIHLAHFSGVRILFPLGMASGLCWPMCFANAAAQPNSDDFIELLRKDVRSEKKQIIAEYGFKRC